MVSTQVQLWPVQELIALLLSSLFQRRILSEALAEPGRDHLLHHSSVTVGKSLHALLAMLPSVPVEVLVIVKRMLTSSKGPSNLLCELLQHQLRHRKLSPASCLASHWLTWTPSITTSSTETVEELITDFEMNEDSLPMHCPLMSSLITNHVLASNAAPHVPLTDLVASTALGAQEASKQKLTVLRDLLWTNMNTLFSPALDYKTNNAHCALAASQRLLRSLNEILIELNPSLKEEGEGVAKKVEIYLSKDFQSGVLEVKQLRDALQKLEVSSSHLEALLEKKDLKSDVDILIASGETWLLVGYLEILLLSKLGHFDPVAKMTLKLQYVVEEEKDTSRMLYARELQSRLIGHSLEDVRSEELHLFVSASRHRLTLLSSQKQELEQKLAYRPPTQPFYSQLLREANHYSSSLGSGEIILGLHQRLLTAAAELQEASTPVHQVRQLAKTTNELLNEERVWRNSQFIFCQRLSSNYVLHFPDMVIPLLAAAEQLCHGTSLLASTVKKLLVRLKLKLPEAMVKLVQFPSMLPQQGPFASSAGLCLDHVFCQQLQSFMPQGEESTSLTSQENYRLIKAGLEELRNISIAQGHLDSTSWSLFMKLLAEVVKIWREQEEEKKTKEENESSWYFSKAVSHCENLTEEQLEALELQALFPTTEDEDFGDIEAQPTLEQRPEKPVSGSTSMNLVTEEDMYLVSQLHWDMVTAFSRTSWLVPAGVGAIKPNYISPLLQRFQTLQKLMASAAPGLDASMDYQLAPSLALLAFLALQTGDGDRSLTENTSVGTAQRETPLSKPSDFYSDTNVEEVRQCLPVLHSVKKRVKELLEQWPEHPTLNQILVLEQRIMSFPITSPVSRFLVGLELLLSKLREWEENAHSGVSIMAHMTIVTERIIVWRRLELQSWKDCLDNAAYKVRTRASKWWFFIFSLMENFTDENPLHQPSTQEDVTDALQQLMEKSTLGEYQARLDVLYAFHCHVTHLPPSHNQRVITNILWNLHCYYSQFSAAVSTKIQELRAPIEKKLKGFVKIARWSDINYWAIKQAVEKTRRTLLKHVREFEKILKQPVTSVLTNPHQESVATSKRVRSKQLLKKQFELLPEYFMAPLQQMPTIDVFDEASLESIQVLPRAEKLFRKSRSLCSQIAAGTPFPTLVQTVNELIDDMKETSNRLKSLEIPSDATLEKKKSVAKSHLQQRRKALTDAFHTLQQLGLSYRLGFTVWHDAEMARKLFDFTLPPVDVQATLEHLKNRLPDRSLKTLWEGCDRYFYQCLARLSLLDTFLKNPHKDIGPPFIERLRGFNTHLMIMTNEQKKQFAESFYYLCSLRRQISLVSALKDPRETLPRQSELQQSVKKLNHLLTNILLCLEQFLVFLQACPVEPSCSFVIDLPGAQGEMSSATKGAPSWEKAAKKVRSIILSATKLRLSLAKSELSLTQIEAPAVSTFQPQIQVSVDNLIVPSQYDLLCDGYDKVAKFVKEIRDVRELFEVSSVADSSKNPMTESLFALETMMQSDVARFRAVQACTGSLKGFRTGVEIEDKELEISQVPGSNDSLIREASVNEDTANTSWNVRISLSNKDVSPEEKEEIVEEFREKIESVLKLSLIVIEKLYKKYGAAKTVMEHTEMEKGNERASVDDGQVVEDVVELQENHLKEKLVDNLVSDITSFQMQTIDHLMNSLIKRFVVILDVDDFKEEAEKCRRYLLTCIPCIEQLSLLYQFFVTQQVSTYKTTCRLMSLTLSVSIDLAQKGFCVPKDLMPEDDSEEAGDAKGGMGLGEGEGQKDVSERIESQDQLEDAKPQGEESKEEDKDCKEEEKGVEMDEDFGGKLQDLEKKEEKEDDSDDSGDEEEPDKEMGETEEGADNLDEQIWGSDSEEDEDDEEKKQDPGQGKETGDPELGAKDDKRERKGDEEDEDDEGGTDEREKKKKDINKMEEPEIDEEQTDPYHGKQDPLPEPEPFDLPDDLQLDDGPEKEGSEGEEDPFDIDKMKEKQPPPLPEEEDKEAGEEEEKEKVDPMGDVSDESEEEENVENGESAQKEEEENKEEREGEGDEEDGKGDEKEKGEGEEEGDDKSQPTEKAMPSEDQPSQAPAEAAEMDTSAVESSQDVVSQQQEQQEMSGQQEPEDMGEEGGDEAQGVGQAEAEEQRSGHRGPLATPKDKLPGQAEEEPQPQQEKRQRPGESDSSRSLGDTSEPTKKRLKTIDIEKMDAEGAGGEEEDKEEQDVEEKGPEEGKQSDIYQHIKDAKESFDAQTLDAATKEQAEKQAVPKVEEEKSEEITSEDDVELHEDKDVAMDEVAKQPVEKLGKKEGKEKKPAEVLEEEEKRMDTGVEVEGEQVPTFGPSRGSDTTFHTQYDIIMPDATSMEIADVDALRKELESQLASWAQPPADAEASQTWQGFVSVTGGLARDLSEQLRLVLEPTQASRLRGDYRTGRRINMRKVIPYIASQFRKDKIWLRRTKPSKRDYQILLAIDDSSSMADNYTRELAFESLALMSQALTLLEAGELGVVSFGEQTRILHRLGDPFTEQNGARLLQEFSFGQARTCVGQLVDFCSALLGESRGGRAGECAQLLLIVSDGRGVFSEGGERVRAAVRAARLQRLFIVFLVLDNPSAKDSILDIRVPVFQGSQLMGINSYLDTFPFPFYLILRDINCLPAVMSDALRQWFELVTNSDTQ